MNHIGLDNTVIVNRFQRVNPFDGSTHEHQSAISALYDASPVVECSEKGFLESLSSDYFSVPFIHVNENSSVEELEDAILKCKHMFLALPKESSGRKERLLDRLIELRRILQDVKYSDKLFRIPDYSEQTMVTVSLSEFFFFELGVQNCLFVVEYAWSRHLFCVPISWYYHEPLARQVCSLRSRIFRLQPYFSVCSVARKFTLDIEKYGLEWFLEQPYTFTMDLISQVLNGKLLIQLTSLLSKVDEHVKQCQICETYVPSYCTVCNEGPVRPHYMKMTFCNRCNKTCHRSCLSIPLPIQLRDTTYYADIHQTYELSESDSDWDRIQDEWVEVLYPCLCVLCKRCGSNQVTLYSSGIL
ncbi:unnamed protein product [Heterobilharzia americana]|nr:unnamed protein product [Heterobilharzia americana]